jgi:hypothetical protein
MNVHVLPVNDDELPQPSVETVVVRMPIWLRLVQAILAYEWLVSGINKALNSHFDANLVQLLSQSTQGGSYAWSVD